MAVKKSTKKVGARLANAPTSAPKKKRVSRTNPEKKKLAEILYTRGGITKKEIAERVEINIKTLDAWIADEMWEDLRKSMLTSNEEQLRRFYDQLDKLNKSILERPEGQQFPNSKEADTAKKITSAIRDLQTETGIDSIVEVAMAYINWLRPDDPEFAKQVTRYFDAFIKERLKRK